MSWVALSFFLLMGHREGEEEFRVLPPEWEGVAVSKMLSSYLLAQAQKSFEARRKVVAALKTPEEVRQRQQELRRRFLEALGGLPERTPLKARTVAVLQRDGYRIEKVIYESRPNHHVTALLYLPEGEPPFPGVLFPCGHSVEGKAAEAYQRACILMAKNGLAVLCYDPISQGERSQLLKEDGEPFTTANTLEHTLIGVGALLVGWSTATYRIGDGLRSLDYLASRPEVDATRLGCTGNSGGGILTAYLMALDDRILAAAPSCCITSLERLFATIGPRDAEQNIPGQVAFGMEHADYLTMRAPKPTLICAATRDYFDINGTWETFREAKLIYGLLGHGERVDIFEFNDAHGFSRPRREAAMRWMRRWLLGKDDAPFEEESPILSPKELQCTASGQVLAEFHGQSVFDLQAQRAGELAQQRAARRLSREELLREVRRLLALPKAIPAPSVEELGRVPKEGYLIRKLLFRTEPGILVPSLLFEPEGRQGSGPLVLYVHGEGKATDAGPGGPIEAWVRQGHRVLALDPRGMGETTPVSPRKNWEPWFGRDYREFFLSLHLARPLLGQRVYDLLSVLEGIAREPGTDPKRIRAMGIGSAGPVVLHAAALDERIAEVILERSLLSWTLVAQTPLSRQQLAHVGPGVLQVYDLPELAATLAPRPLTLRTPLDATGQPASGKAVEETYAPCREAYRRLGAEQRFRWESP